MGAMGIPSGKNDDSMYTGEMSWHRFGTKLTEPLTAEQAVHDAGLNWTVLKKEICAGETNRLLPNRFALVREDLWQENGGGILGSVRPAYTPLQNVEAFSFLDPLVQTGVLFYESAGSLAQGEWVWMMLRLRGDLEIAASDRIARFLLFGHTPRNGYHRLSFTPVRLASKSVLSEGFFHNPPPQITAAAYGPRRFEVGVDAALQEIQHHFDELANQFRSMLRVEMNKESLQEYLNAVFSFSSMESSQRQYPEPAESQQDRRECIRLFTEGKGNDLPFVKGTLWAAYCAIAEYVDFYKLKSDDPKYLYNVWSSELKAHALRMAIKMAPPYV